MRKKVARRGTEAQGEKLNVDDAETDKTAMITKRRFGPLAACPPLYARSFTIHRFKVHLFLTFRDNLNRLRPSHTLIPPRNPPHNVWLLVLNNCTRNTDTSFNDHLISSGALVRYEIGNDQRDWIKVIFVKAYTRLCIYLSHIPTREIAYRQRRVFSHLSSILFLFPLTRQRILLIISTYIYFEIYNHIKSARKECHGWLALAPKA